MIGDAILSEKIVKVICGFFRSPQNCRGYDLKTPIGKIADCAFRHHNLKDRDILELEKKIEKQESSIAALKAQVRDYAQDLYVIQSRAENEIRYRKYKRCLDNAWWCRKLRKVYALSASTHRGWKIAKYYDEKSELYCKWQKLWLALADKFKEAK